MKRLWMVGAVVCASWLAETGAARAATCMEAPTDPDCTCPSNDGDPCTGTPTKKTDYIDGKPVFSSCEYPPNDGALCRGERGPCDQAEYCSDYDCPADRFEPTSTMCRAAPEDCDVPEFCTGSSAQCPANRYVEAGTHCRDKRNSESHPCDLDDYCTGTSPSCPEEVVEAGVGCNDSEGPCDPAETCDGVNPACPADEVLENGYACDDGNACTDDDMCLDGQCVGMDIQMCMAPDAGPADAGPADAGAGGDAGLGAGDAGIGSDDEGGGCQVAPSAGQASLLCAALLLGFFRRRRRS